MAEACRRFLADWDGRALLQALPRRLTAECALAAAAQRLDRADHVGMLSQILKHLRSMCVAAPCPRKETGGRSKRLVRGAIG